MLMRNLMSLGELENCCTRAVHARSRTPGHVTTHTACARVFGVSVAAGQLIGVIQDNEYT